MNWKHVWLTIFIGFGFAANAQNDRAEMLQQACRQFDSALIKKDTSRLSMMLLRHFEMKHSNGLVETKKELLQHLSEEFLKYDEIVQVGEPKVLYNEELAFVERNLNVRGSLNGGAFNVKLIASEDWSWNYTSGQRQLKGRQSKKTN